MTWAGAGVVGVELGVELEGACLVGMSSSRVDRRAKTFLLLDGEMYKRSPSGILMRCIPHQEGIMLLEDIHSGACGHHAAPRTLVGNAFRQGFYWPTAVADATEIVWTWEGCQLYAR